MYIYKKFYKYTRNIYEIIYYIFYKNTYFKLFNYYFYICHRLKANDSVY